MAFVGHQDGRKCPCLRSRYRTSRSREVLVALLWFANPRCPPELGGIRWPAYSPSHSLHGSFISISWLLCPFSISRSETARLIYGGRGEAALDRSLPSHPPSIAASAPPPTPPPPSLPL